MNSAQFGSILYKGLSHRHETAKPLKPRAAETASHSLEQTVEHLERISSSFFFKIMILNS
jgi:hypothetical protein